MVNHNRMKLWKNVAVSYCLIMAVMGCGKHNLLSMHRGKERAKTITVPEKQIAKKSMVQPFLMVMAALALSQLTPVQGNNTTLTMRNHDLRADSYLTFNPTFNILFATQDVDITTACSGQFLDTATRERCVKKCNARLTWLLNHTEPIRNRFNDNNIILYARDNSRRLTQVNSYQYPQVALTQTTADGRVKFCGWRVYDEEKAKSLKSPPDEIQKIWKETSGREPGIELQEREKRIEKLERVVAIMLSDDGQLKEWCNQSDTSDLANGIMDSVTEVLHAIETEKLRVKILLLESEIRRVDAHLTEADKSEVACIGDLEEAEESVQSCTEKLETVNEREKNCIRELARLEQKICDLNLNLTLANERDEYALKELARAKQREESCTRSSYAFLQLARDVCREHVSNNTEITKQCNGGKME